MSADTYAISKIVGTSEKSIEDAIDGALATASKTLRSLDWFEVTSAYRSPDRSGEWRDGRVRTCRETVSQHVMLSPLQKYP